MARPVSCPGLVVSLLLAASGCNSLGNVGVGPLAEKGSEPFRPFGGVRGSLGYVRESLPVSSSGHQSFYIPVVTECIVLATLVDVPLSLAGDLVTLPICLHHARPAKSPPAEAPPSEPSR